MENINEIGRKDFIDVYVINTLNEIKKTVSFDINLDKQKEAVADEKMSIILKDLINSNFKNLQVDAKGNLLYTLLPIIDAEENKKIRLSLVLYYTALYYDNVDLLHDLLRENINFNEGLHLNLHYLDKSISSKFDREDYISKIKSYGYIFNVFARSIKDLSEEDREKYILRFAYLFNLRYEDICSVTLEDKMETSFALKYLFTKENLDTFEDNSYRLASKEQLRFINFCQRKVYKKETCQRLNNLIQNSNYSNRLCNFDLMIHLYSDEELETLDFYVSKAIDKFSDNKEMLNKILNFIVIRPDLVETIVRFSKEAFMKNNNYFLIEVCDYVEHSCYGSTELMNSAFVKGIIKPKSAIKRVLGSYKKRKM